MTADDFEVHVDYSRKGCSRELPYCALALAGEAGELANLVKKNIRDGGSLDEDAVILELGDVMWYATAIALNLGVDLEYVFRQNVAKLRARRVAAEAAG